MSPNGSGSVDIAAAADAVVVSASISGSDRQSSDQIELEKMASLRVKSGEESYLVQMRYTDTIAMLKEHIKSIRLLSFFLFLLFLFYQSLTCLFVVNRLIL